MMRLLRPGIRPFLLLLAACGGEPPAPPPPASNPSLLAAALAPVTTVPSPPASGAEGAAAPSATPPPPVRSDVAGGADPAPSATAPGLAPSRLGPGTDAHAGDPACVAARVTLDGARARARAALQTVGVAEKRALGRAEALLAACESSQRCVEEEPEERAKRYEAVVKARDAVGAAQRGLQRLEVAVFDADRAAAAACGGVAR